MVGVVLGWRVGDHQALCGHFYIKWTGLSQSVACMITSP